MTSLFVTNEMKRDNALTNVSSKGKNGDGWAFTSSVFGFRTASAD